MPPILPTPPLHRSDTDIGALHPILGQRHLERVLRVYRRHYNEHRPHRALQLLPPDGRDPTPLTALADLRRRDLLGGLTHEYEAA